MALVLAAALAVVLVTRGPAAVEDTAAALVPPDALVYAHVATDRTQDTRLTESAARFTTVREQLPRLGMAFTPAAGDLSFERDVQSWVGDDMGVAMLAGGPMLVASVRDEDAARAVLKRLGATSAGSYKGTALVSLPPSATAAFTKDHLVVGPVADVRGAIDRAAGNGTRRWPSRACSAAPTSSATARRASTCSRPPPACAACSASGIAARLVAGPRLEGVTAAVGAEEDGVRVTGRVMRAPGAAAEDRLRAHAGGAGAQGRRRLPRAARPGHGRRHRWTASGGAAQLEALRNALPQAAGVELDDLLEPLSREATMTVTADDAGPVVTLTARTSDAARTREALARLQGPVGAQLAGGSPFTQRTAHGTDAFTLPVTDSLEASYAVSKDALVASTARSGLDQLVKPKAAVTAAPALQRVMPDEGAKVEALGFLDPRALLALAERTGLPVLALPGTA